MIPAREAQAAAMRQWIAAETRRRIHDGDDERLVEIEVAREAAETWGIPLEKITEEAT